jgi:hypothetical protein
VRLLVGVCLEAVFEVTQEAICIRERADDGIVEIAPFANAIERGRERRRLQRRITPSPQELYSLDDELDLANAAGSQLHVVLQLAPLDLAQDEVAHAAQRLEHAEVEVASIDEGAEQSVELETVGVPAREQACLEVGVSLPLAPMLLEIGLERAQVED